ncbi:Hypothetical_protein [Hexamita inflata]|uniref:Hypothetical_protein n=1 Tax=Hexamita inflata TaxID=28002 RepID=A0ABP1L511_9EUKA
MQTKGLNIDQVQSILVKEIIDISGFVEKKGISNKQIVNAIINQNEQALVTLIKSKLDVSTFVYKKGMYNDQVILILAQKRRQHIIRLTQKGSLMNQQSQHKTAWTFQSSYKGIIINEEVVKYILIKISQNSDVTNQQVLITLSKYVEVYDHQANQFNEMVRRGGHQTGK